MSPESETHPVRRQPALLRKRGSLQENEARTRFPASHEWPSAIPGNPAEPLIEKALRALGGGSEFAFDSKKQDIQSGCPVSLWSGQRGSNSLPPPWQGGALPDELCPRTKSILADRILFVNPLAQYFLHFPKFPPAAPPPPLPPAPPDRPQAPPGVLPDPAKTRSVPPDRPPGSRAPAT